MKTSSLVRLGIVLLASVAVSHAANVSLTTSDTINTSSLNTAGKWSNGQAPSAANDYFTSTFFMRTPGDSGGVTYTFAGNSLTLQAPSGQGTPMRSILYKGAANDTIVINNLTNAAGGVLNQGGSGNLTVTFTGNLWTIAGNSTMLADQGPAIIGYPIVGADGVVLTNAGGNSRTFTGSLAGLTGKFFITRNNNNGGSGNSTVIFGSGSSNLGNPSSSTPDQITVSGGTTLTDNAGLTFNNSNGGITLLAIAGQNNATINAGATTVIAEPITDRTNGVSSVCGLTQAGSGILVLSSANNNYAGGTTISGGTLRMGVANAVPVGTVTDNAGLDLNTFNTTIDGLSGSGMVDTQAGGTPTLTVGANGGSGSFSGALQNSQGTLSIVKAGAGTETFSGAFNYSGDTVVAGGTLSLVTAGAVPSTPGSLIVSNGATLAVTTTSGTAMTANNIILTTNGSLSLTLATNVIGINASNSLTVQDNATLNLNYGTVIANPTAAAAINVTGGISAPGTNIVINIAATGLKTGTFTLIKYAGTPLSSLANFSVSPPPGVAATLVNNTGNTSIDLNITSVPNQLAWNGVNGTSWDLVTANWSNLVSGGITVFQQYTNGNVVAGDSVLLDDTLTNDFINPQPTNIVLNSRFFAFPFVVNSTRPYSIAGAGGIAGVTSLAISNTGSLTLLTSNGFSGGVSINGGSLIITNDSALGASAGALTLNGGTLQMNGGVTNSRAIGMPVASTIGVGSGATARLAGVISGAGGLTKTDVGTLVLAANETFTGNVFGAGGTMVVDSGSINNGGNYSSIGLNTSDVATLTLRGTGSFTNTADFNVGDIDSSAGTLNLQDSAVVSVQNLFIASANAAGSTASGTVNMNGGSLIEKNTGAGNFVIGGRNSGSSSGVGVINLTNGYISGVCGIRVGDFGTGTVNQYGGTFEVTNNATGINLHRENNATSFGTYNLNGGTLRTEKVTSSFTSTNSLFYFNGGTLQAGSGNLGTTPFMNNIFHTYIRNGAAIIDSQGFNIIVSQALEHSALGGDNTIDGGLIKLGSGTLTLSGVNTFSGPITNKAGTVILNSASTYSNTVSVNAGILQMTTTTTL
jgi:autotransporter-associated beta strand protein